MKRSTVSLTDVADWSNLQRAFYQAARGKRFKSDVRAFSIAPAARLDELSREILSGQVRLGRMHSFRIRDPKPRTIHAPCFEERVLHHALIAHIGPLLDRSLVADTYACRTGKGPLAAVRRVQVHSRRYPWFAKIDIRAYFASVDHAILFDFLRKKFKDRGLLSLLWRILDSHHSEPGKGLPIGALTSQVFANFYLAPLDRWLLEEERVGGMVRYMDDVVWFDEDGLRVKKTLRRVCDFVAEHLSLTVKDDSQVNRSRVGVTFGGYRVFPSGLRLSSRRRRLYTKARAKWEQAFLSGGVGLGGLQMAFDSALSLTIHAHAASWRRHQLDRTPLDPLLLDL